MGRIKIKKGLDLPINGEPVQIVREGNRVREVALLGDDYVGMRPAMNVAVGDYVRLGQVLFTDRKIPSIKYTSPGSGKIIEINRGPKRHFESIVIALDGDEEVTFKSFSESELKRIGRDEIVTQLIDSGLWTSLRSRPFSRVANPETVPHSIFITAMDTNPLAPSIEKIIEGHEKDFTNGLTIISRLTDGNIYLCKAPETRIPVANIESLSVEEFDGPHPAGNAGTHIHFLDPVSRNKQVWHINSQDVIAVGRLFTTGRLRVDRVISLAGPAVDHPRLIKTRIGASTEDITSGELKEGEKRIISGSVLSGHTARGSRRFLGRYHQQISVIPEGGKREFLGWLNPGLDLFSVKNVVLSRLFPSKRFDFNTSYHGSRRPIVPIGSYEKVMPFDILPTFLLRALIVNDIDEAEKLGCLELDEEDLALCSFVCPSKIEHGQNLRKVLTIIEKEG